MPTSTSHRADPQQSPEERAVPRRGVVAAVAGDALAPHVVETASTLATQLGLPLTLVHSPQTDVFVTPDAYRAALDRGHALLDAVAVDHPEAERVIELGPPDVLVKEIASAGASLIVIGSQGRGPFASALLGSVSQEVVRFAACPVVVVPVEVAEAADERGGSDAAG